MQAIHTSDIDFQQYMTYLRQHVFSGNDPPDDLQEYQGVFSRIAARHQGRGVQQPMQVTASCEQGQTDSSITGAAKSNAILFPCCLAGIASASHQLFLPLLNLKCS
jgi:hypothetical protein